MKKSWVYTEKVIAVLMILLAVTALSAMTITAITLTTDYTEMHILTKHLWELYFIKSYQSGTLYYSAFIFSGITLLMNRKSGWIIAIALAIDRAYILSTSIIYILQHSYSNTQLEYIIFLTIQVIMFFILLQKPYRDKYLVNKKTWLIIVLLSAAFISEPYIVNHFLF